MSTIQAGAHVLTAEGAIPQILDELLALDAVGENQDIGNQLSRLEERVQRLGDASLADRIQKIVRAFKGPAYGRPDWVLSDLHRDLAEIRRRLNEGEAVVQVLASKKAAEALAEMTGPRHGGRYSVVARPGVREAYGPEPTIDWSAYGDTGHRAPDAPPPGVRTAGQRLYYFANYMARTAGYGDSTVKMAAFYDMSVQRFQAMQEGRLIPKDPGNFTQELNTITTNTLVQARRLTPRTTPQAPGYAELMYELLIQAVFEAYGWPLGAPTQYASWDQWFLYELRRDFAKSLLGPKKREAVLADQLLRKVVKGTEQSKSGTIQVIRARLTDTYWHPGKLRRDVFEPWLRRMAHGNPERLNPLQRELGDRMMRDEFKWTPPRPGAKAAYHLQWMLRQWIVYYHYGALPDRLSVPFHLTQIEAFVFARQPVLERPQLVGPLLTMMNGYFPQAELNDMRAMIEAEYGVRVGSPEGREP